MYILRVLLALLIATTPAVATVVVQTPGIGFRLIVNPKNPVSSADRKFITDAFLKKATRWDHVGPIRPVDQRADSSVRAAFSSDVLRRPVAAVRTYWHQLVFSGRDVPPPEMETEHQVVDYVLKHAGAIGYVSAGADLLGAKVISIR